MRKALSVLAVLAALGATSALAATSGMSEKATGTIKSIDKAKSELILKDGKTFDVQKGVDLAALKPGEKVTITYTKSKDKMDATEVKAAP
jgi:Cu/Ag efflux protein CusF